MDDIEASNSVVSSESEPPSNVHGQFLPANGQDMNNDEMKSQAAVTVTKNFVQCVHKIVPEEPPVQRRLSPRLQNISLSNDDMKSHVAGTVTKNFVQCLQNIVSEETPVQRRFSPRLQNVPLNNDEMKSQAAVTVTKNFVQCLQNIVSEESPVQRRSSPRLQNIPVSNDEVKSQASVMPTKNFGQHVQNIVSKESPVQRRSSPRLRNITLSNDEMTPVTPTKKFGQHVQNTVSKESPVQRRFSPRLQNIPVSNDEMKGQTAVTPTKNFGQNVQNIVSKESPVQRRFSPRLQNIPLRNDDMKSQAAVMLSKNFVEHVQNIVSKESSVKRRLSPRLQNIPENKKPYYGSSPDKSVDISKDESCRKKAKVNHSRQESLPNETRKEAQDKNCESDLVVLCSDAVTDSVGIACSQLRNVDLKIDEEKGAVSGSSPANAAGKSAHARVKETLRLFNTHYLHFTQEEEKRCKKLEVDLNVAKGSKSKKGDACEDVKRSSKRPDLKAVTKMMETNAILYPKKRFGHIPGIDVGHQFFSRAEMVVVGLHCHWLNGIDFMGMSYRKLEEYNGYTFPLAVAVVLSGQYEDDLDNSEDVVYTGQGGNDLLGNKRQVKDQVLCRGNLALKNNMEQSILVRVIRGHESANSYCGKVYTYDGLYKVVQYWAEKGVSGFTVFKYCLRRIEGQPTLTTNQVHFSRGRASRVASELPGLVCEDICQGQEDICIPATNLFDDAPIPPAGFKYMRSIQVAESVNLPLEAPGCKCKGNCTNPNSCSCAQLNGSDFPYVRRDGGRLVEAQDVVFECGPNCGCGPSCVNRTSQRGLKYRLEVFRTPNKGWAVRSWDSIPSGAPVCEYIGVLKRSDELDNVSENDYIFEIDCWQTIHGIGGRERRLRDVSVTASNHLDKIDDKISESSPEFCIDAGSTGNVARFINHSCDPNLFVQCVLSSHHDIRLARVVLFAADNIPPLQELTYDYGYALDSVIGSDGKIKELPCYCGAACCRKRLY